MDKITLDRETFKALASDTRLDILKRLDERQKTVTELARELELNKATVHEHLEKLEAVHLIQKLEDERKWVYWQLTWTGRRLLHPEKITVALLLSTALGALLTAAAATWVWLSSNIARSPVSEEAPGENDVSGPATPSIAESQPTPAPAPTSGGVEPPVEHDPVWMWVAGGLALLVLLLIGAAVLVWRRAKARHAVAG